MRLYIIGGNKLGTINVNDKTEKSVSVSFKYNEKVDLPLNLEKTENSWKIVKNDALNVDIEGILYDEVELSNYKLYFLNIVANNSKVAVMPTPTFETVVYNLSYSNLKEFSVGSNNNCQICYHNLLTQDIQAVFKRENNSWYVENPGKGAIYLNGNLINKSILKTGDIVFINGLKIIWNNNFIRVNNPDNTQVKGFKLYEKSDNKEFEKENDLLNIELYNNEDYFYPKFLINNTIDETDITLTPPPSNQTEEEMPFLLTLGSSITMLGSSFMMTYMVIYNLSSGSKSIALMIPQIVTCVTMILGSLLMPKILSSYNKKRNKQKQKKIKEKYLEYLKNKEELVNKHITNEELILNENNPNIDECMSFIKDGKIANIKFWARNIKENSFASIRLGNGETSSKLHLSIEEKDFSLETSELEEKMYAIVEKAKTLHNVPIVLDLKTNNKTGIMLKTSRKMDYISNLLLQLAILHSPYDLKIVIFTNKENDKYFNDYKYLPHMWSDDKQFRFYASSLDEIQKISEYLVNEYKKRKENINPNIDNSMSVEADEESYQKDETYKKYQPYYIIIDDNYMLSKNSLIVNLLNDTATNFGFSYLGIGEQLKDFPNNACTFVEVNEKNGNILEKESKKDNVITFNTEYLVSFDIRNIINQIANIPIISKDLESSLPQSLTFLEMLDVSRIEQLNILNRWKMNSPVTSLSTPVGVHSNGDKFKLDLHEKAHGPHGLIAGMTGSGKSEFILTYILSMIINYHPYEVQFVLIDYKGGGLAGAFENKEKGYKVPHLVGTITNLDTAEMNRTLVSIQSECRRRQILFNEVKEKTGESTIDIYKYQRLYREGAIKEPLAHLFIICDEFAELKAQQPEFMTQLISVARIGRSLGIHLILATQKPTGVVNDQIWSNSKFKVCLKVQDRSDSMEMLKKPDAASIKEVGRFYLQVGYDDYFDIGQSGWSGAKYIPTDYIIKKVDDSINFVSNTGEMYKTIKNAIKVDTNVNLGDQLTNIVKSVCELAKNEKIVTNTLWLDKIPENIYLDDLKKKYNYEAKPFYINPIIGEYDDPNNQEQGLVTLDLTNNGNTLIYGATGSGKEQLLSTIVSSISKTYSPEEVNMYILDFGSGSLKGYKSYPHVGDIATIEEPSKVTDTFNMLYDIIDERRKLFADYSGNYNDYINSSGNKLPLIVVMINNYEIFVENNSRLSDNITNLYRDASKYGIIFIVTVVSSNGVRGRMAQYFNNKICLQLPDSSDYRSILNAPRGLIPSDNFGRGLITYKDTVLEFQTALLSIKESLNDNIKSLSLELNDKYKNKAKSIPTVPDIVLKKDFEKAKVTLNSIPIGYDVFTKNVYTYDASKTPFMQIITENMTDEKLSFIYSYIDMLTRIENTKVRIVDFIGAWDKNDDKCEVYKDNWDKTIVKLHNDIIKGEKASDNYIYVFLGIGLISKILSADSLALLDKVLTSVNKEFKSKFVLVDTYNSIKNLGTEIWYQSSVDRSYGIWLGENIGMQLAINITNLSMDDRKLNFPYMAFAINNGKHKVVKYMVEEVQNEE